MLKALIAVSSFSLGSAAVGAVVYMQSTPLAFTQVPETAPSDDPLDVPVRPPELPLRLEVRFRGIQVAEPAATQMGTALVARRGVSRPVRPCSAWWPLGPKAVAVGTEDSRNVRALCE